MTKQYIGDGVYVEVERGMLKLTTDRVAGAAYTSGPDTIYLEPGVWLALKKYAHAMEIEIFVQNRKSHPRYGPPGQCDDVNYTRDKKL